MGTVEFMYDQRLEILASISPSSASKEDYLSQEGFPCARHR